MHGLLPGLNGESVNPPRKLGVSVFVHLGEGMYHIRTCVLSPMQYIIWSLSLSISYFYVLAKTFSVTCGISYS